MGIAKPSFHACSSLLLGNPSPPTAVAAVSSKRPLQYAVRPSRPLALRRYLEVETGWDGDDYGGKKLQQQDRINQGRPASLLAPHSEAPGINDEKDTAQNSSGKIIIVIIS